jgi:dTDP-4-amino-4,6-dideoxygalactose transaminase
MINVEYENLKKLNSIYFNELREATNKVIESGWYILGNEVRAFEKKFSNFLSSKHCIGVSNGMDALEMAFSALDLPSNSEVITSSHSYIATILAIKNNSLKPVLAATCQDTFNIDHNSIEKLITKNTSAICVTHMYGNPCKMDEITKIAKKYNLKLVEDCAQAHGSQYMDKMVGTFGDIGCFSFYPTKNLGALGDAGALVTENKDIADKLFMMRNYGSERKYFNKILGSNRRLDEIQAAILNVKLNHFSSYISQKNYIVTRYKNELSKKVQIQKFHSNTTVVQHIFSIITENRDEFRKNLKTNGVLTEVHYPIPVWKQKCMLTYNLNRCLIAEQLADSQVSIPSSIWLNDEQINHTIEIINMFYK